MTAKSTLFLTVSREASMPVSTTWASFCAVRLELARVVAEVVAERVDRAREGVLGEVEVADRQAARGVRGGLVVVGEDRRRVDRVGDRLDADVLQPVADEGERVDADLPGRRAELDLGLQAVLLPDAVAVGVGPAGVLEDLRARAGSNVAGVWSAKNQAGRDVRVGDRRCRPGAGC